MIEPAGYLLERLCSLRGGILAKMSVVGEVMDVGCDKQRRWSLGLVWYMVWMAVFVGGEGIEGGVWWWEV